MPAKLKLLSWSRFILSSARMCFQQYELRRQAPVYYICPCTFTPRCAPSICAAPAWTLSHVDVQLDAVLPP